MADYKDILSDLFGAVADKVKEATKGTEVEALYEDGKEFARGAGNLAKTKLALSSDQDELRRTYLEIGKLYYEEARDNPDEYFAPLFNKIEELNKSIAEKQAAVAELKKSLVPPKIDEAVDPLEVSDVEDNDGEKPEVIEFGKKQ